MFTWSKAVFGSSFNTDGKFWWTRKIFLVFKIPWQQKEHARENKRRKLFFSINVAKACSYGEKISKKIDIYISFILKHIFMYLPHSTQVAYVPLSF